MSDETISSGVSGKFEILLIIIKRQGTVVLYSTHAVHQIHLKTVTDLNSTCSGSLKLACGDLRQDSSICVRVLGSSSVQPMV